MFIFLKTEQPSSLIMVYFIKQNQNILVCEWVSYIQAVIYNAHNFQEWLKMNSVCDVLLNPKTSHQVDSEEIQELVNYEVR